MVCTAAWSPVRPSCGASSGRRWATSTGMRSPHGLDDAPSRLSAAAALRLARHVDAVGAAPVSTTRLNLVVRREVLDGLPRRRRRRRTGSGDELTPGTSALAALTALDAEQRIALVLRHHDGLLLPDIAAALGLSYPEAEAVLRDARERLAPVIGAFDDGTGADPYARLVRACRGRPMRWPTACGWPSRPPSCRTTPTRTPGGAGQSRRRRPLGWEGFNAVPVDEHHVPPVREARRVGTTLVIGAAALAAAAGRRCAHRPGWGRRIHGARSNQVVAPSTLAGAVAAEAPPDSASPGTGPARSQQAPAEPDLVIDPASVPPSPSRSGRRRSRAIIGRAAEAGRPRPHRAGVGRLQPGCGTTVDPDGTSEVWLVRVSGEVRRNRGRGATWSRPGPSRAAV